ncbi:MAG: hypothetical protein K2M69_00530 [Muribaculaceae bacterium]|nr:hypothetical protein [Muribaculaceae bacterium]
MNNGNLIQAPVNTDDVATVLGVASHNLGTLCRSDRVNPHSLIAPVYTQRSDIGPADMPNIQGQPQPMLVGTNWRYLLKNWGFWAPCVGNPADIKDIANIPWWRVKPTGNSFNSLVHFDGYQHNAEPHLPVSAQVIAGRNIVLSLNPGTPQTVLSSNGKANPGGVVALYEVLGAVRIGCTIYEGDKVRGKWISPNPIGNPNGQDILAIETGIKAASNAKYTIVPWATDGNITANGDIVVGSNFFSLSFSEDFEGMIEEQVPPTYAGILNATVKEVGTPLSRLEFHVTFFNGFDTAQTIRDFRLRVSYTSIDGVVSKDVTLTGNTPVSIPAHSSTTTKDFSTSDSQILSNYKTIRSMMIVASWLSPSGLQEIQSMELAGMQTELPPMVIA